YPKFKDAEKFHFATSLPGKIGEKKIRQFFSSFFSSKPEPTAAEVYDWVTRVSFHPGSRYDEVEISKMTASLKSAEPKLPASAIGSRQAGVGAGPGSLDPA